MNTKEGYGKLDLTDNYVLTSSGGHKAISSLSVGNADTLDGYHESSFVKTKTIRVTNDYEEVVILLWKDSQIAYHYLSGKIFTHLYGSSRNGVADVDLWFSRWSDNNHEYNFVFNTLGQGTLMKLVTCTYNSEKWWAILCYNNINSRNFVFFGIDKNISFTKVLYRELKNKKIINQEIYDSIEDQSSKLKTYYVGTIKNALMSDIPTKVSQLTNDSGYIKTLYTLTLQSGGQSVGNTYNATSTKTYNIPLATQTSSTNTYGVVKGNLNGTTNSGNWANCKIVDGVVQYYDRANDGNNYVTQNNNTDSNWRPILFSTNSTTSETAGVTNSTGISYINAYLKYQASTNTLYSKYLKGEQLTLTATTGTAPLKISSQTRVDNLNVLFLSGYSSDLFLKCFRNANYNAETNENGSIPILLFALMGNGKKQIIDPEFYARTVDKYTNAGNNTKLVITRGKAVDFGLNDSGNTSGYVCKFVVKGLDNPSFGGFYSDISSKPNKIFVLSFRALLPKGYHFVLASNHMGNNYQKTFITSAYGTGKWEWYGAIILCGNTGTFSSGGHVYVEGSPVPTESSPLVWYLAYEQVTEITNTLFDVLNYVINMNEFDFILPNYNNNLWINHKNKINTNTSTITSYHFGNGQQTYAPIYAASFKKNGGTSSQFLKADGSVDSNTYLTSHQSLSSYLKIDGSNATETGVIKLINKLSTASATPSDSTGYVCGEANNSNNSFYRRTHLALYKYISGKLSTLTLQKNGSSIGTFKPNSNSTINITVPSKFSDLTNDFLILCPYKTIIDASSLDNNTYYPVTIPINSVYTLYHFAVVNTLNSNKPSWATHSSGFSTVLLWSDFSNGWGTVSNIKCKIYECTYSFCDKNPLVGLTQNTNVSVEAIYVRGGGKYYFYTSRASATPVLNTTTVYYNKDSKYETSFPIVTDRSTLSEIKRNVVLTSDLPTSLKNPNTIKFKNIDGTEISYDGSSAVDLTAGVYMAKLPYGFSRWSSGSTWGNTTGTSFACWTDSTGGAIDFRRDNPSSGKMSIKVDGRVYVNEGTNPVISSSYDNGYWGLRTPDGGNDWIRTPNSGIIPYVYGNSSNGHSSLGTSEWYFYSAYIQNIYGTLNGNASTATSATTASKLGDYSETSFFRARGNISTDYVDLTTYTANATNYQNPLNGIYNVQRTGSTQALIAFTTGSGSTTGLDILLSYSKGSTFAIRRRIDSNRVSGAWENIITSENIADQSVKYATSAESASSATNADKLDGYHAYTSNKPYGAIPIITSGGIIELGKSIEFHHDNTTGSDYSTRLYTTGNHANSVALPSGTGTLALKSDIPSSLPASDVSAWAKAANKPTYSWSEITNKPSSFDTSVSNKNASVSWNTKTTIASVNGTDISITIPANPRNTSYLLKTEGDNRSTNNAPSAYTSQLRFDGIKNNSIIGNPSSDSFSGLLSFATWANNSGGYPWQIAFNNSGISVRRATNDTTWGAWRKVARYNNDVMFVDANVLWNDDSAEISVDPMYMEGLQLTDYATDVPHINADIFVPLATSSQTGVIAGSSGTASTGWNNCQITSAGYVQYYNTDANVKVTHISTNSDYRVALSQVNNNETTGALSKSSKLLFNPSTGKLTVSGVAQATQITLNSGNTYPYFLADTSKINSNSNFVFQGYNYTSSISLFDNYHSNYTSSSFNASNFIFKVFGGYLNTDAYIKINKFSGKDTVSATTTISTGQSTFAGTVLSTGFYQSSDIRYKTILDKIKLTSEQIATLPLFTYKWKNRDDSNIYVGTSAQSVEKLLKELVTEDNGFKSLNYATFATVSSISLAREIVKLKQCIKQLENELHSRN